jgi:hypothetical protein
MKNKQTYFSLVSAPAFRQFDVKTTAASFFLRNGTTGALKYLQKCMSSGRGNYNVL